MDRTTEDGDGRVGEATGGEGGESLEMEVRYGRRLGPGGSEMALVTSMWARGCGGGVGRGVGRGTI